MRELEHSRPADIEAESFRIIGAELAERGDRPACGSGAAGEAGHPHHGGL